MAVRCTKNGLSLFLSHLSLKLVFYTSLYQEEKREINHLIFYLCSQYVNTGLQLSALTALKESIYIHSSKTYFKLYLNSKIY